MFIAAPTGLFEVELILPFLRSLLPQLRENLKVLKLSGMSICYSLLEIMDNMNLELLDLGPRISFRTSILMICSNPYVFSHLNRSVRKLHLTIGKVSYPNNTLLSISLGIEELCVHFTQSDGSLGTLSHSVDFRPCQNLKYL